MNYQEIIEFLFNSLPMYQRLGKAAYKANLDNTIALDNYLNSPHKLFKTIHVAGTNGKGSVSHSLASILQESGYKTGLYTSPHLVDYRERIRVNGEMISKEFVTYFINSHFEIITELTPSFFEMSVALAFEYFKFCKVDIAIIEVGMGGRLDSTNIITPEISIITNIGFDHTQFLGDTLEKIATEKAGIIKPKIPVIIGETQTETENVFKQKAKDCNSEIIFADSNYNVCLIAEEENYSKFKIKHKSVETQIDFCLSGFYQQKNLATILQSVEILRNLKINISDRHINNGLKNVQQNTSLHGRWEILDKNPLIVCDTGHNKEGISYVVKQIRAQEYERLHIVLGFVNDKNISEVLSLFPKEAEYYFTQASIPRAMPAEQVKYEAEKLGLSGQVFLDVKSAYIAAKQNANKNDMIFIGGSTFIVGDLFSEQQELL